jgi:hypothetical protein
MCKRIYFRVTDEMVRVLAALHLWPTVHALAAPIAIVEAAADAKLLFTTDLCRRSASPA